MPGQSCLKKPCLPPARRKSKSSARRITFVMKPEIRTIPARGEHCKMVKRPRKYSLHYATSDRVPKSDPKATNMAKVKARQLAEVVRNFDCSNAPSCRFLCTESSLTCRACRSLIKLKTCPIPLSQQSLRVRHRGKAGSHAGRFRERARPPQQESHGCCCSREPPKGTSHH